MFSRSYIPVSHSFFHRSVERLYRPGTSRCCARGRLVDAFECLGGAQIQIRLPEPLENLGDYGPHPRHGRENHQKIDGPQAHHQIAVAVLQDAMKRIGEPRIEMREYAVRSQ